VDFFEINLESCSNFRCFFSTGFVISENINLALFAPKRLDSSSNIFSFDLAYLTGSETSSDDFSRVENTVRKREFKKPAS